MTPRTKARLVLWLALLFGVCPAGQAQQTGEAKLGTPITTLPYTISSPGVYVINQDFLSLNLTGPTAAIQINASDVVLDLNGHTISNTTAGAGTLAYGVYAANQTNVKIRNGTVQGFMTGVALTTADYSSPPTASYGHLVERMNVNACTYEGISLVANDSTVRSCQVTNIGGSSLLQDLASAYGIELSGTGLRCLDCDVSQMTAGGTMGVAYAIYLSGATDAFVVNNRMSASQYGLYFEVGANGQYRNNLATGILTQGFAGGTDAGKNMVDANSNGIDDEWEAKYFPGQTVNPTDAAPGGGGLTILQAYQQGYNPNDFYLGKPAKLSIVSGNPQSAPAGSYLPAPLVISVTNTIGTPAVNASASFTVTSGGALLQAKSSSTPAGTTTLQTDGSGQAHVYVLLPSSAQISYIAATSGNASPQTFTATATSPPSPPPVPPPGNNPFAPSNVVATLNSDGSLDVSWQNSDDNDSDQLIPVSVKMANGSPVIMTVPADQSFVHFDAPTP